MENHYLMIKGENGMGSMILLFWNNTTTGDTQVDDSLSNYKISFVYLAISYFFTNNATVFLIR